MNIKIFLLFLFIYIQSFSVEAVTCNYTPESQDDYQSRGNRCEGFKNRIPLAGRVVGVKLVAAIVNRPRRNKSDIPSSNAFKLYLPESYNVRDIKAQLLEIDTQNYIMDNFISTWNVGEINRNNKWGTEYIKKIEKFNWSNFGVVAYLKKNRKKILVSPILLENYSSSLKQAKDYTFIFKFERGVEVKYKIYKTKGNNIISESDDAYRNKPFKISFKSSRLKEDGFYTISINKHFFVKFYHRLNYQYGK